MTELEFPTVGQIWHAQEPRGARVVHVQPDGARSLEDSSGDRRADGARLDHARLLPDRRAARLEADRAARARAGALVLLDAYQAVGSLPLDVARARRRLPRRAASSSTCSRRPAWASSTCRPRVVASSSPTQTGWFADEDVFEMDIHDYSPARTARRFESGTPPVPSIYAGVAGIELMQEIGIAETERHVRALDELLIAGVEELGGRSSRRGPSGAAPSSASARRTWTRSSPPSPPRASSPRRGTGTSRLAARLQHRGRHPRTVLAALARTAACLLR